MKKIILITSFLCLIVFAMPLNVFADERTDENELLRYSVRTKFVDRTTSYGGVTAHITGSYEIVDNSYVQNIDLVCSFSGGSGSCSFTSSGTVVSATINFSSGACALIIV